MKKAFMFVVVISIVFAASKVVVDLSTPMKSIRTQYDLLKAGDTQELRGCFTDRLKEMITEESVKKGREELAGYSFADCVSKIETGSGTAKIKMKNGRSLTTLIEKNGKWYADTIWFR